MLRRWRGVSVPRLPHGTTGPGPRSDHISGSEKPPKALEPRQESVMFRGLEEKINRGWVGMIRLGGYIHS